MTKVKVTPVIQVDIARIDAEPHFTAKGGHYHLVSLDKQGNEKAGSDFSVNERTFDKNYKHLTEGENPTFKVKKNPNIQ